MTPPSEPPVCPACGLALPPGLPASGCPRCLLAAGMAASTDAEVATKISSDVPGPAAAELTEGAVIDRYRIGRRIGRGGMGEVYAAEQVEPVRRPVAFKVIKRGMDTDQIIGRFQTERQALALMDHPNIAVVLDAGATPGGRPFFVMEFVQGVPLTTFCDDKNLPLRARLELFLAVCVAVQHAHQKGIIHRDLKPSNILVSEEAGQPMPKVIDFGLAKATGQDAADRTLLTEAGQVLGTPAYMSPEQAGGTKDLDTRADVYALGAILYELITGEPPFDRRRLESAAWEEILRLIREEEPPRPSARLAQAHRHGGQHGTTDYGTTGLRTRALSHAHGEEHGKEHRGKHGVPALAASVGPRAGGSPNAAAHEPPEGGTPNRRGIPGTGATRSTGGTRSIPADLDWIVMKALEKERARRYDTVSGLAGDVRHFLAHEPVAARPPTAAYRLGKFVRRHRRSLATAAVLTAGILSTAGVWAKSEWEKRQRAAQLSQQVLGLVAEAERLMRENDRVEFDNGEPFLRALELSERAKALLGRESPDRETAARLDPLLAAVGQEQDDRELIGELEEASIGAFDAYGDISRSETFAQFENALNSRGIRPGEMPVEAVVGRWKGRREAIRTRIASRLDEWSDLLTGPPTQPLKEWLRDVVGAIDHDDAWRLTVRTASRAGELEILLKLAESPGRTQQPVNAVVQLARALNELQEQARGTSLMKGVAENNPSSFWAHLALGMTMADALDSIDERSVSRVAGTTMTLKFHETAPGRPRDRRREYDEAIGHLSAAVALRPGSVGACVNLANALMDAGRTDEGISFLRRVLELKPDLAVAHSNLSIALHDKGKLDEAIAEGRKAIELRPEDAALHVNFSDVLKSKGDWTEAIAEARRATGVEPDMALAHASLGKALHAKGEVDEAIAAYRRAIELEPDFAWLHLELSRALESKHDWEGAIAEARKAIELQPGSADARVRLGAALYGKHDVDGAIAEARRAIELKPELAAAHLNLGTALFARNDLHGAMAEARRAIALEPDVAMAHYNLGTVLYATGDLEGAIAAYREAIELGPGAADPHLNLGAALRARDDFDGAILEARRAIELKPDLAAAHANLSSALFDTGDWDGAIAAARKAIELQPDLATAHGSLADALEAKGDLTAAIEQNRKAIELQPDEAGFHLNLGVVLFAEGDFDEAIAEARRAIELKPDWPEAHGNLGNTLYSRGDLEGAMEEARKAIELQPDFVKGHGVLGFGLAGSGLFPAALEAFERGLAQDRGGNVEQWATYIAVTRILIQMEAAVVNKLRAASPRGKPPARADHEPACDEIYRQLPPLPPPSGSVLREYARSHREEVEGALERGTIEMITIPKAGPEVTGTPAGQQQLAAAVRRKAAGGADFGDLVSAYSVDPFASKAGRRDITRLSLKKPLSDAAFALKPGELSPVLEDEGNLYLIRMVARQAPAAKAIDVDDPEVKSAIAALIEAERREAWKEKFWRQCVEKARGR